MNSACPRPPAIPQIIQGEDKTLVVNLTRQSNGAPFDLTNITAIVAGFLNADNTTLEKTLGSGVTIVSPPGAGQLQIALTPSDTAGLAPANGDAYGNVQLKLTDSTSKVTMVLLPNSIQVYPLLFPMP
jgi:hypothetical protein